MLDASGSIQSSRAVETVRSAAESFLDALRNTNSQARVTQFGTATEQLAPTTTIDDAALAPSGPLAAALAGYYNPRPPVSSASTWEYLQRNWGDDDRWSTRDSDQYTNWDAALDQANDGQQQLVVFITDGDPTALQLDRQGEDAPKTVGGTGWNTFRSQGADRTVNRAIEEANAAKAQGSRVLAVGVGSGLSNSRSQDRLKAVSGPQLVTDADLGAITSINDIDVAAVRNFGDLAQALRSIVLELCSPSLTVRKFTETTTPGEYLPAPGWDITVEPEVPNGSFSWILPDTAPATSKTEPTNGQGFAQFQWEPDPQESDSRATVTETLEDGFAAGRPGDDDYVCELRNEDGDVRIVSGDFGQSPSFDIPRIGQEIVTCSLYNSIKRADLTLEKAWIGGQPGDSAVLTVEGSTDGTATSNAPDAPTDSNSVTVPVLAGETVDALRDAVGEYCLCDRADLHRC